MAKKSSSASSSAAEHKHSDLEKKIASLEKKVEALEKALASAGPAGEDDRVSKIWEALYSFPKFHKFLK